MIPICILVLMMVLRKRRAESKRMRTLRRLRTLRNRNNAFHLHENAFRNRFRFPRALAKELVDELQQFDDGINPDIPFHIKVLSTLYFYANGSFQIPVGDCNSINMSQPSVCRSLHKITKIIVRYLGKKCVPFPTTQEDKLRVMRNFQDTYNLPHILGAIDCSHIAITKPPMTDMEFHPRHFRNRKRFYSLNIEATCTSDQIFTSINARFPGACHDSSIWAMSPVREYLQRDYSTNQVQFFLADCGYPGEPWLLSPYVAPQNDFERRFNTRQIRARSCIEQAFGVLKGTFKCLSKTRTLYYHPTQAGYIVYGCVILYNYLKMKNFPLEDREEEFDVSPPDYRPEENPDLLRTARNTRSEYVQRLFNV